MRVHDDLVATREDVVVRVLQGSEGIEDALDLLDAAEAQASVPLVDESERERLHALASGAEDRAAHWHSLLARRHGAPVGYAGLVLPEQAGGHAVGDLAILRGGDDPQPVLAALLAGLEGLSWRHEAGRLQVWLRHADSHETACVADQGFGLDRRLGVLGRSLDDLGDPPPTPAGVTVRAYRPDEDDEVVVAVLAAAYDGTPDGGWTLERFRERRDWSWFRPDDLLVAEAVDGTLTGVHWLKRRSDTAGEVYNLAIHPQAQGSGLGATLLHAGLSHLRDAGLTEVVLWVDLANERAVRLYTSQGFHTRWEDVAVGRTLRGSARS